MLFKVVVFFGIALISNSSSTKKREKPKKYIIELKNLGAVQRLKTLSPQDGGSQHDNLNVECDHYYESAIFGGYCDLTKKKIKLLRDYLQGDLLSIQKDAKVQHNSQSSRHILQNAVTKMASMQQLLSTDVQQQQLDDDDELMVFTPLEVSNTSQDQLEELSTLIQQDLSILSAPWILARSSDQSIYQIGYKNWALPEGLWNLDRIDQRLLPLNREYVFGGISYIGTGEGVTIYVVDSGIRPTHTEFDAWRPGIGSRAQIGYHAINTLTTQDCDGHGTHIASTAVGRGVGVAKEAQVVGVRVLDCDEKGELKGRIGNVVAGLDWVSRNVQHPAIVTLSLGLKKHERSTLALEQAIKNMVNEQNITFIVASGNSPQNLYEVETSCDISPSHMSEVITVGASDLMTKFNIQSSTNNDSVYVQGNTGACVDIFAPGVDIYGACGGEGRCSNVNDTAYTWQSGTSMAVPHVAGAVAIFLGEVPSASPEQVKQVLVGTATTGRVQSNLMQPGTTTDLLYINIQDMIAYYKQNFQN